MQIFRGGLERFNPEAVSYALYLPMGPSYTNALLDQNRDKTELFIVRYVFQASLYAIWRERNQRKHGEGPMTPGHVIKMVDKNVHNRLSSIRDKAHTGDLSLWFGTR